MDEDEDIPPPSNNNQSSNLALIVWVILTAVVYRIGYGPGRFIGGKD